jgi:predicted site-specific integrase-resolvase
MCAMRAMRLAPATPSIHVALYARVSTDRQAEAQSVDSQLVALRERATADGQPIAAERKFVDEGYSGATLVRPALERLRDLAAAGGVERLYVHSPDRLARTYVHQVLLLEELARAGVRTMFLNQAIQQTPEDELLLQVQGVIAEYERARDHGAGAPGTATCRPPGLAVGPGARAIRLSLCQPSARGRPAPLRGSPRRGAHRAPGVRVGGARPPLYWSRRAAAHGLGGAHPTGQAALGPWYGGGHAQESGLQGRGSLRAHAQRPLATACPSTASNATTPRAFGDLVT